MIKISFASKTDILLRNGHGMGKIKKKSIIRGGRYIQTFLIDIICVPVFVKTSFITYLQTFTKNETRLENT